MEKKFFNAARFLCLLLGIGLLHSCQTRERVDFSTQIKPILNKNCITCHGGVKKNAGFSLLFEEEAFANTESGIPAIIRGDAANSEFIKRLHEDDLELRMPYEKPKLSDEEIDLLTRWVEQGAEWGEHWAYSLPDKVDVPTKPSKASFAPELGHDFIQNDIDHFILARLEDRQLAPNAPAEKNSIARRVALDLIGLPPSSELLQKFNENEITYETMVDSLLAQDAFGEKWATW
ncbi:unnamed protein product, partial [Ectocarpus sp. 12 AP-2014]